MMEIQTTTRYSDLVGTKCKRTFANLAFLERSMRKYGFDSTRPLHCTLRNGKIHVVDGSRRLEAARRVGCPVYFVVMPEEYSACEWASCRISRPTQKPHKNETNNRARPTRGGYVKAERRDTRRGAQN